MWSILRPALILLGLFTVLTGLVYPLVVTGVAQVAFPHQANGSLIEEDGRVTGSELIAQGFAGDGYFWSRSSAVAYNAATSSGTNLGPTNPALHEAVTAQVSAHRAGAADPAAPVPVDLVTSSGSGLDPHITPAGAEYQVARVAAARGMEPEAVRQLVAEHTEGRFLGLFGEPRVNVLRLNLALERASATAGVGPDYARRRP